MPAALQYILAVLLLPGTVLGRFIRPARRRAAGVDAAYMARITQAEQAGNEAFLDRELAQRQPTADSLRQSDRPSPTHGEWPDEDLNALFGPEIAATAPVAK